MYKHRFRVVFQGPICSFNLAVTPWCVPFGPKYVDGVCVAKFPKGAGKFGATIVCQCARLTDTLYVLLECVECVDFGADG